MEPIQRRAARIFAITYLLSFALMMGAFPRFYAPYLVWQNGEETARHLLHHEPAIRLYLTAAFLHGAAMLVILMALYVLLRAVHRGLALLAAFAQLVYAVFWFISLLCVLAALHILAAPGALQNLGPNTLAALAGVQLDSSWDAYYIGLVFNGLGSALFAGVLFQSRYVPRLLSLWGVLACLYEGLCGFAYLLHPAFGAILSVNTYELPAMTFHLLLCLWFLSGRLHQPGRLSRTGKGDL